MVRMTVVYPSVPDARFDLDYYREQHMPLVRELLGDALVRDEIWLGDEALGEGPAAYRVLLHMHLASREAFDAAFATVGERIVADIPSYTDIEPVVQFETADAGSH